MVPRSIVLSINSENLSIMKTEKENDSKYYISMGRNLTKALDKCTLNCSAPGLTVNPTQKVTYNPPLKLNEWVLRVINGLHVVCGVR